jgi:hypothetical protein
MAKGREKDATLEELSATVARRALFETFTAEQDALLRAEMAAVDVLYDLWRSLAGKDHSLSRAFIHQLVHRYDPSLVQETFYVVAPKVSTGELEARDDRARYLWACLRNKAEYNRCIAMYEEEEPDG